MAAYLALARVSLDQDDLEGVNRGLTRVAEIGSTTPERHSQLAAAGLNALCRADAGDRESALAGVADDNGSPGGDLLVLDNLHEITSLAVHESLLRLVQRPPPGLRFEATTRRHPPWPLDRLRRASPDTLVEALTEREHVMLRYLASTLSNAEIAAELYLLINTVKTDQRMVYRKLGATGCRDAIRRAKQLRIL